MNKLNLDITLQSLANDNDDALALIFNHYYPRLYNFAHSFLKLDEGIDDILQEVFVKIWQKRKSITSSASFNSLIFTITKNLLLNELRNRLTSENMKKQVAELAMASAYNAQNPTEYEDLKTKVDEIIETLPERSKEVFLLSRKEGLSHKEIAEKLNISTKTIEYHISQATKTLREKLRAYGLLSILWLYLFL